MPRAPAAAADRADRMTSSSGSARSTDPSGAVRSPISNTMCRGTSGSGRSSKRSVGFFILSRCRLRRSRKPAVVKKAIGGPVRSITMLVLTVVPCMTSTGSSASSGTRDKISSMPLLTALAKSGGVEGSLSVAMPPLAGAPRQAVKSVKVPPMSMPIRSIAPEPRLSVQGRFLDA